MDQGLKKLKLRQSTVDPCVYYSGKMVLLSFVYDVIVCCPKRQDAQLLVEQLRDQGYEVGDTEEVSDYLGVKVQQLKDGTIALTQPHLINSIIKDLHLNHLTTKSAKTPASSTAPLRKDPEGIAFDGDFDYRLVVGKLNFLEKSTRPDICLATHQCAKFSSDLKKLHGIAVKRIGQYLVGTADKGLILTPNTTSSFDCWVDASFSGDWDKDIAMDDPSAAKLQTGYLISYKKCPLVWSSKMQTEIALSTGEAEYIALSQATREVIPMMGLYKMPSRLDIKHLKFIQQFIANCLKTTLLHMNWPRSQRFAHEQSISTLNITTFGNLFVMAP